MPRRYSGREIEVECMAYGYASIGDFDTEVLIEELNRRAGTQDVARKALVQLSAPDVSLVEIYEMLGARRFADAMLALERFIWPKWKTIHHCMIDAGLPLEQKAAA